MKTYILTLLFWWTILSIISIALIINRDDGHLLIKDIKQSFADGLLYGLVFIVALLFYAPLTLPYSINHYIEKWK
jgi:hypothetical protein